MTKRILIVEDDVDISDLVALYLKKEEFETSQAFSGEDGIVQLNESAFDLVVLDLNLPGMDGYRVLNEIREASKIPVVICSAREADEDVILGLSTGADDFVSKPFSPRVLVERVKANLRRFATVESSMDGKRSFFQFGSFRFYEDGYYLEKDGNRVRMASRELDVLFYLLKNAGKNLTVRDIFNKVWGSQYGDVATVAVHIQRIRKKIEIDNQRYILTTYGAGYQFDATKLG